MLSLVLAVLSSLGAGFHVHRNLVLENLALRHQLLVLNRSICRRQLFPGASGVYASLGAPVRICRERDDKGNYVRADRGEIAEFTGVTAPYEAPPEPTVVVNPHLESVKVTTDRVLQYLTKGNIH